MCTVMRCAWAALAACLLWSSSAQAQPEQWLRYGTAADLDQVVGYTSTQQQGLSGEAPEGVDCPQFAGAEPLFAKWNTPMVQDGVWCAFDRSGENGPIDRLYIDADVDGQLADESPIKATQVRTRENYERAEFKLVAVILPGEDGPVMYHLNVTYRKYSGNQQVYFEPACWYEGRVIVGGQELWCTLLDNNGNGRFNDASTNQSQCDRIRIARKGDRSFRQYGRDKTTRFLGRHVEVEGQLYLVDVAPDGAFIKLTEAGEVPTGTVQVGKTVNVFSVFGDQGHFYRDTVDGAADVPAGTYTIHQYEVTRRDKAGVVWQVKEKDARNEPAFTVEAGNTIALDISEPFLCPVEVSRNGSEYRINQMIRTARGDRLDYERNGSRPPAPKIRITNADRTYDRRFQLEYG